MTDTTGLGETRYLIERRRRFRIVLIAVPALLGLLLALWTTGMGEEYLRYRFGLATELLLSLVVGLLGTSGVAVIMTYLQTGFKKSAEQEFEAMMLQKELSMLRSGADKRIAEVSGELKHELSVFRNELEILKGSTPDLDETIREEMVNSLRDKLTQETTSSILAEIKAQVGESFAKESRDKDLYVRFDDSRNRLTKELEALTRRGNLNLALGVITTIVGLLLLGVIVFTELTTPTDPWSFISHFAPRLTLVLFIELFAYFFLSLYKSSLSEIKYFQNELTNIESQQLALRTAIYQGEKSVLADIVVKLASTERNHVLSKDQTTVEIEKARLEKDTRSDIAKCVSEFFQKKS